MRSRFTPRRGLLSSPLAVLILFIAISVQPAWSWKCALIGAAVGGAVGTGIGAIAHSHTDNGGLGVAYGSIATAPGFIIGGLMCGEEEEPVIVEEAAEVIEEVGPIGIVYFDFDKYNIRADQVPVVDGAAAKMQSDPGMNVSLQGNTDAVGSEEYNLSLGENRAYTVQRALEERGVESHRMSTVSFGEDRPAAPNTNPDGSDNPEGRALNRRTEILPVQ